MMPFFVICCVIALVVGPVMMLRPSPAQQKAAKMRQVAVQTGLLVASNDAPDKPRNGIKYILPGPQTKQEKKIWRLNKLSYAHDAHFYGPWDLDKASERNDLADSEALKHILGEISEDVFSIGVDRVGAFLCWSERLGADSEQAAIEKVKKVLSRLADC